MPLKMSIGKGRPLSLDAKAGDVKPQSQVMDEWGFKAELLIKRGMQQRAWGYRELAEALNEVGIRGNGPTINRRINRGNFNAGFLLACLSVLGNGADVAEATKLLPASGSKSSV
ncbi:DUF6471 domain-containing protein [Dechloromonas sp. ARDL1]|uniref:DUF6471 domain-containing protein n=1 Tax=Dechloromonas sp. ARDL1 TaxID=3322121 RepID=UPI003DA76909